MTVALAHREDGPADAPAVLLSPSLGTTWGMWDDLAAALASTYRVVRYDTRGHGRSPVPPGPYTVTELAGDVLALADSLEVERFGFVGLSLGGAIGQTLLVTAPERVAAAVLCCTVPKFGEPSGWAERAAAVRAEGMASLAEPTRGRWFTDEFRRTHGPEVERLVGMLTSTDPEGYASCCDALAAFDLVGRLGAVQTPTRVVAGAEDPVSTPEGCAALAEEIPGADLVVIGDASHIASAAQPAAFHAAVVDHLGRHL
jgi:3-oxoadipate enol-lactonase